MRALLDGTASTVTTRLLLIIIHEWIESQTKDNTKMMAVILIDIFRQRFG